MQRSLLIPVAASFNTGKTEKPLNPDVLPNYLRTLDFDPTNEFESVFVPNSNAVVYPTVVDAKTCIPVYLNEIIPTNMYTRSSTGIAFDSSYAGKIVYLYRPKITYGTGQIRNDNLNYRTDTCSSIYLKVGQTIQDSITLDKPFRITLPYEGKPDKIADKVYKDYQLWWVIMQYNGLIYPENCELESTILIPDFNQVKAWLKRIQPSTANPTQYKGQRVRL